MMNSRRFYRGVQIILNNCTNIHGHTWAMIYRIFACVLLCVKHHIDNVGLLKERPKTRITMYEIEYEGNHWPLSQEAHNAERASMSWRVHEYLILIYSTCPVNIVIYFESKVLVICNTYWYFTYGGLKAASVTLIIATSATKSYSISNIVLDVYFSWCSPFCF